jgi:membrane-bound lytic murein transglycosylase
MRDPETIETELMEIGAIADDAVKLERIIAWCACHPDEVPFALHQLMNRRDKHASQTSETQPLT